MSTEEDRFRLLPEDAEGVARDIDFCLECKDFDTARRQLRRLIELLSRTDAVAALPQGDTRMSEEGNKHQCRAGHRYFNHFRCTKPKGHDGDHGYAGSFWDDAEATDPRRCS